MEACAADPHALKTCHAGLSYGEARTHHDFFVLRTKEYLLRY